MNGQSICNCTKKNRTNTQKNYISKVNRKTAANIKNKGNRRTKKRSFSFKNKRPILVPVNTGRIQHHGMPLINGDIVSLVNDQRQVRYAQIRCLLQDQYYQNNALITWLFPTEKSFKGQFDPATYIIGHEDNVPRSLDFLEFVCHQPSEYFKSKLQPDTDNLLEPDMGYVLTSKGYKVVTLPCIEYTTDSE
ncbi:GATA zinc finger domain-containing protein 1 [Caerostris darwini]|uniref:GATA zinc finger domain-containing protein 1 n=1 Tax=Caerostris darwini TaxID=1538125 RepID=A0AAV4QZF0_9ARAC|nr:GATA zinc finger domain-containing protein 1 [Caerostris darwini]